MCSSFAALSLLFSFKMRDESVVTWVVNGLFCEQQLTDEVSAVLGGMRIGEGK